MGERENGKVAARRRARASGALVRSQTLQNSPPAAAMASSSKLTRGQVASAQVSGDFAIKPESSQPALDTSQWPLLLKNYDKLLVRSAHFTPIPSGCSPLKRDITAYVKCVQSVTLLSSSLT